MEEKITTICPHCNRKMKVKEMYLGKKIRCPKCKEIFKIELLESEVSEPGLKTEQVETADYEPTPAKPLKKIHEVKPKMAVRIPEEVEEEIPVPAPFSFDSEMSTSEPGEEFKETLIQEEKVDLTPTYPTYSEPKMKVFKNLLPENPKIVNEFKLGVSGWIVPESTKVLVTENEVFIYNSRRYLFGIFPGGKKIASYPVEFKQLRAGMLRVKSLFAMLLTFIISAAISFGAWFIMTLQVFDVPQSVIAQLPKDIEALWAALQTPAFYQDFWWLLIPVAIAVIWILLFWRCTYKTQLFKISFSRWRKKNAQNCLRQINEQAVRKSK